MGKRPSMFPWAGRTFAGRALVATAVALLAFAGACNEPLSPEMERRLIATMLDPVADSSPDDFGGHFIHPVAILQLLPQREIMVEVDGEWAPFGAVVIERVTIPDTGNYGTISRSRRMLVAWRLEDPRERFVMGGRAFPGPMGPHTRDDDPPGMFYYRPSVTMRWSDGRAWMSSGGEAAFDPLTARDECPWPVDDLDTRLASGGCQAVEYEITFKADLDGSWGRHSGRSTLRMQSQMVPGVRLTYRCDSSPATTRDSAALGSKRRTRAYRRMSGDVQRAAPRVRSHHRPARRGADVTSRRSQARAAHDDPACPRHGRHTDLRPLAPRRAARLRSGSDFRRCARSDQHGQTQSITVEAGP